MLEALELSVSGKIHPELEVVPSLLELNEALDRVKSGKVMGKLVVDLR
jgi:D-arabinose 1-dehydrogenase-like Zn-dependent alcohol dehydrogenase